jgi:hypothetical protein
MIYRRYGSSYQSVDVDFDAKALNDIGFRRNRADAIPVDDFDRDYERIEVVELRTEADGGVQTEAKQLLLDRLRAELAKVEGRIPEGGLIVIENESGHDYPKTRQQTKNVVEEGENRLWFDYTMEPALRVAVHSRRS